MPSFHCRSGPATLSVWCSSSSIGWGEDSEHEAVTRFPQNGWALLRAPQKSVKTMVHGCRSLFHTFQNPSQNICFTSFTSFTSWHEAHLRFNRVTDDLTSAMPHLRKFARPVDWGWLSNDPWPTLAELGRVTVWIVWYLPRGKNTWCQRILRHWKPRIGNWGHNPPKIVRLSKIRGVENHYPVWEVRRH